MAYQCAATRRTGFEASVAKRDERPRWWGSHSVSLLMPFGLVILGSLFGEFAVHPLSAQEPEAKKQVAEKPADSEKPAAAEVAAQVTDVAELFPDSTMVYVESREPKKWIAAFFDHAIAQKIQTDDRYRALLANPDYTKFRFGLGLVELSLGMTWRKSLEQSIGGGIAWGVDSRSGGNAIVAKCLDPEVVERLRDFAIKTARDEARKREQPDPVETTTYRGVTVHRLDRLRVAMVGSWLIATDHDDLGKSLLDRCLGGDRERSLAADTVFREARSQQRADSLVWGCLRLDRLRDTGRAAGLVTGKADNPVAELVAGGVLATLGQTRLVTVSLAAEGSSFQASVSMPFESRWIPEERHYFFGESSRGEAPGMLRPRGALLHLTTHRDLAALWNSAPDLFDEKTNNEINQANSNLSTLFSGRDFGQEVLASIGPAWQIVAARQDYSQAASTPQIKVPAGALVAELRDPEKMRREWKVTFQSLIGFLNIVSSMQGQPPLELDSEKIDGIQLVTASYAPPEEGKKPAAGSLHYNFSPSLALVDSRIVISSTRALALELARAKPTSPVAAKTADAQASNRRVDNSRLELDVQSIREALQDNREPLIAQNMLEKGHARGDAEREIDTLLTLLELVRSLDASLSIEGGRLEFRTRLGL